MRGPETQHTFPETRQRPRVRRAVGCVQAVGVGSLLPSSLPRPLFARQRLPPLLPLILGRRTQLLHEMDGVEALTRVVVIAATNRPDLIDPALLRPGRFDRMIYVALPDESDRREILRVHTARMPLAGGVSLHALAEATRGYSGAELAALCREAAQLALSDSLDACEVTERHIRSALEAVPPRTDAASVAQLEQWAEGG